MKFLPTKSNSLINADFVREIYVGAEKNGIVRVIARMGTAERVLSEHPSAEAASAMIDKIRTWLDGNGEAPDFEEK